MDPSMVEPALVTAGELQSLQEADGSLCKARKWVNQMTEEAAGG